MTLEAPHPARRAHAFPTFAARESLQQLPTRRLPDPSPDSYPVHWERIDVDRYEVRCGAKVIGFIDVVGAVFVVLAGKRYAKAVEVSQTLVFDEALAALA